MIVGSIKNFESLEDFEQKFSDFLGGNFPIPDGIQIRIIGETTHNSITFYFYERSNGKWVRVA